MSGRIIKIRGDHDEAQALIAWYAAGTLDGADLARVEAHLAACPDCQAELRLERRLKREVADLPFQAEEGWTAMLARLETRRPRRGFGEAVRTWLAKAADRIRRAPPWLGWALAAQAAAILVIGVMVAPASRTVRYHTLGAAPTASAANVVVIFSPDTTEAKLRQTLRHNHARLVGGPTAADAYLLAVPAAERPAALASLRGQPDVEMAEPVDSGGPP